MSEKKNDSDLRDANAASEERPVPSQAEGELDTVEQDLKDKEQGKTSRAVSSGNGK